MLPGQVFGEAGIALPHLMHLWHRMKWFLRAASGEKHRITIVLSHQLVMLQLQVLEHICLFQVRLVQVKKLATDETIVLWSVIAHFFQLINFLLQVVPSCSQLLFHHLEVRNLLVQLNKLLTLFPLLFFLFNNLFKFIHFLLGQSKFGLVLPRKSIDVAIEHFNTRVSEVIKQVI